ncbi:MAG TPA: family 43 glycosylhydrolase [Gemmatimonadaceae bacterium]|nr:family 43 glycosylhydrolase [Gemmatimonadaceae bacterium]
MRSLTLITLLPMLAACATSTRVARPQTATDPSARQPTLEVHTVHATSNPIVNDGVDYTTDPAPLVVGDTLYILTGRDTAAPGVNDFKMPEWQMLATTDDPMAGRWTYYPHLLRPEKVFKWAAPGRAYAAQIVQAPNGKFYLYAPVVYAAATTRDKFAIGVAVADTPLGPWVDAHPAGPIVSEAYPIPNHIQNIDPTVLVDDDGRVYLYWGTFGHLKGVELEHDMVTFTGTPIDVHTLTGFFEAAWLFKRNGTYYLAYAANNAGPTSDCTEAVYYACIAYGTSPSPLGPWTYRGVILDPVSSTTSHPGIIAYKGKWYITYHTADAKGGGHFRRSVAIDRVEWDDSVTPARIRKVVPTGGAPVDTTPIANIASHARITASNVPVPVQYWLRAVNDGKVRVNPLPPDMWATWSRNNPPQQWIMYQWEQPETLTGSSLYFWGDHPAGSGVGVAPPKAWRLEYWDGAAWRAVSNTSPYTNTVDAYNRVDFTPVTTRCLRAVFDASTDGKSFAAVALQEWDVYSTRPRPARQPSVKGGATADCSVDAR